MPAFVVVAKPFLGDFDMVPRKSVRPLGLENKTVVQQPVHIWRQNEVR